MNAEVVYESSNARVLIGQYPADIGDVPNNIMHTERKVGLVKEIHIHEHYYWPTLGEYKMEVWVYPQPEVIEAESFWEPEWTFNIKIRMSVAQNDTPRLVVVLNGAIRKIIPLTP